MRPRPAFHNAAWPARPRGDAGVFIQGCGATPRALHKQQEQLMTVDIAVIGALYERYLGRTPDPQGLQHFQAFNSADDVERAIVGSDEFRSNGGLLSIPDMPVAWKICILEKAKLIFVPIAKNAHTSILTALLKARGIDWRTLPIQDDLDAKHGTDDDKIHAALAGNNTGLLLKDLSPGRADEIMKDPEYLRVAVFRDPLDRIVSACNHFFVQELDNPMAQRHSQQIVEIFGSAPDGESNLCEYWLRRLMKFLMTNKHVAPDAHWMPQYEYIRALKIDHIVPIERLDVLEKMVAARSGERLDIGLLNVRGSGHGKHDAIAKEVREAVEQYYWLDRHFYELGKANIDALERQFDERK
ncbi:sulfotransferase family 2 domain-containing protein [Paraburkholderia acidiphila]|uniref:Sulfotransferase domain-containing protein n=1 Tax=Paraburkholderia acidiphila TaxID=2571747 RepID=A0A7Z2J7D3_9BURK|nr:sulfotransferase family 2 domain-containing protein [Paraburkholderia acidiphila]QGZ54021.1 hypothetical protein FAZ97_03310 [Paraburkholderia acidiphila]